MISQRILATHGPIDPPEVGKIGEVCSLLWSRKGKRLRAQWVYWFGEPYGLIEKDLELYAWAVEAIHTATLFHDDVIDKAPLRRGGPSANVIFDNTLPILSGDYLLSDAIFQLAEKGHFLLLKLMCQAVKEVTQGEVLQYENRFKIPQAISYFETLNRLKTSALLKWSTQVGAILATGSQDPSMTDFALRFGDLYQFTDDLLDLRGSKTKASWQDLTEGKVNEAAFLLLQCFPLLRGEVESAFEKKEISSDLLEKIKKFSEEDDFRIVINEELRKKRLECEKTFLPFSNKSLTALLGKLVQLTVERLY